MLQRPNSSPPAEWNSQCLLVLLLHKRAADFNSGLILYRHALDNFLLTVTEEFNRQQLSFIRFNCQEVRITDVGSITLHAKSSKSGMMSGACLIVRIFDARSCNLCSSDNLGQRQQRRRRRYVIRVRHIRQWAHILIWREPYPSHVILHSEQNSVRGWLTCSKANRKKQRVFSQNNWKCLWAQRYRCRWMLHAASVSSSLMQGTSWLICRALTSFIPRVFASGCNGVVAARCAFLQLQSVNEDKFGQVQ